MNEMPKRVVEVAEQLKDGRVPRRRTVRAVLKWFGVSRRGVNVLSDVKVVFANLGLQTDPVFEVAGIDELVRFSLVSSAIASSHEDTVESPEWTSQAAQEDSPPLTLASGCGDGLNGTTEAVSEDQLEPEPEEDTPTHKPDDRPVTSQSSDWTISALRDKLDRGQLDLQPKFQREYVWNLRPELPSRLIESLLLEIPIPPIYFGKVNQGRLEMIDGQMTHFGVIRKAIGTLSEKHKVIFLTYKAYEHDGNKLPRELLAKIRKELDISQTTVRTYKFETYKKVNEYLEIYGLKKLQ